MGYTVLPTLIPDMPRVYDIYFAAFKKDPMGRIMLDILFPNATIDSEEFRQTHAAGTLSHWHIGDVRYTFKCLDTQTGDIVGMSRRSEDEPNNPGITWLEREDRERAKAVLNPPWEMGKRLFGGRSYICEWQRVFLFCIFCFRRSAKNDTGVGLIRT